MSCRVLSFHEESPVSEAYPREMQEALVLIHIFIFFATIEYLLPALIILHTLELCGVDVDAVPPESESDLASDLVQAVHNPTIPASLDDTTSSSPNSHRNKYDIDEDEIADDDVCEFTDEELDEPYYTLSPRARGWQRIRSNWLKERAVKRAAHLAQFPPLPRWFATPLHSVQCRRPALSLGKKSLLRESLTPDDFEVADEAAETEVGAESYPPEEDLADFFKSYLDSRNGTQSVLFTY